MSRVQNATKTWSCTEKTMSMVSMPATSTKVAPISGLFNEIQTAPKKVH